MKDFPNLVVIAAHFGGWSEWDDGVAALSGLKNLYVDTCSSLYTITPEQARAAINAYGAEHVMFATDYPMWCAKDELAYIDKIDLTDAERELILYKNALRLFWGE
jgi:predicted TIM-barrel fold metal-dependent hydrolase